MTEHGRKIALMALGWIFVGLGLVGVLLPVLPTTPFMLVALWCFARSSDRFHAWLYNHRFFGPPLRKWERHRVIPLRAKVFALTAMGGSLFYITFVADVQTYLIVLAALFMAYGAWFILTKPSTIPDHHQSL